jgi:DNA polymerase I-like protein with 3'-5' exonuclease and polymerase domains
MRIIPKKAPAPPKVEVAPLVLVPEEAPVKPQLKVKLVNTALRFDMLMRAFKNHTGYIGFDTEVVGPALRDRSSDFVNISKASLLGLSIAFDERRVFYVPVRHRGNNCTFMQLHQICEKLQEYCAAHRAYAHNSGFDHQVMIREGYPVPGLLCSMVSAWLTTGKNTGIGLKQLAKEILDRESPEFDPAIGSKTGEQVKLYAGHDALNALQIGEHYRLHMADRKTYEWFLQECEFAYNLAKMKLQGFGVHRDKLRTIREDATKRLEQLQLTWDLTMCGSKISITSSKQLQELFTDGTWTPHGNTKTRAFQTGSDVMAWNVLNAQTETGRKLAQIRLDYQEVAKIVTTYTDGLIEESLQWDDKKLHPDLFHFGTVTGRLASANPNIQNQPAHGDWAKRVRECFIPDHGMMFTSADYSQVELRYFANECGGELLSAFLDDGADIHQLTADAMKISRQQAKTVNFGFLLYGGGPDKLAKELGCSLDEAEMKIEALHQRYPSVAIWRQQQIDAACKVRPVPMVATRAGRVRHIPELLGIGMQKHDPKGFLVLAKKYNDKCKSIGKRFTDKGLEMSIRSRGERLVVNYLVQGGCRDLLVLGINQYVNTAPDKFTVVTTVHDEVLTQHPIGLQAQGQELLKVALESAGGRLGLKVPIIAEPKSGRNWSEVK